MTKAPITAPPSQANERTRILRALPLIAAAAALLFAAPASAHPNIKRHHRCSTVKQIWSPARWRRGAPKQRTIDAFRSCPRWTAAKRRYYRHRSKMLWLAKYKPFVYPDGTRWAVPWPIAICESGEDYFVGPSGAYGLIPPFPQWMPPRRQDEVAANLYREMGDAPWAPYETACYLR